MLKIILTIISFLFFLNLPAQELIRFTTKQGLPSNLIYDMVQDSEGFMWFATNRGVVKYDGITFKTFTIKDGLPNNDTWKLEADFQGRVWCFSKSNYQGYIQNDSIYKFLVPENMVISPTHISKSNDRLWMEDTSERWQMHLGLADNKLKKLIYEDDEKLNSFLKGIYGIEDRAKYFGRINPEYKQYVVIIKNELIILDFNFKILYRKKHEFIKILNSRSNPSGGLPNQAYFLMSDAGILFINHKKLTSKYWSLKELIGQKKLSLKYCKATRNEIQICMADNLLIFDYDFNLKESYIFPQSIPNHKSYKDNQGNIWFIDLGKGISLQPNTQLNTKYFLKEKSVQKIGQIKQFLFAGISFDGFYKFNSQKEKFEKNIFQNYGHIYQISYDEDLHIGYLVGNGINARYKNGQFVNVENNIKSSTKYLVNFNDSQYILNPYKLLKKDLKTNIETVIQNKQGLLLGKVYNNSIYLGASDGLYKIENDKLKRPSIKNDLLNTSILALLGTRDHLIIGTDGRGLLLYNKNKVVQLEKTEDLSIQKILKKEEALWIASQKGVFKIKLDENNLANSMIVDAFLEEDGLLENNTNDIYIEDNFLYAASDMGLARIDINNPTYRKKPNLYFNTPSDTLLIEGGKNNNINVSFSVLDFVNQENYNYDYRLLPNQKEWTGTAVKTLNFSNLSPNLYTLEIKASDQHGNQSIERQYLEIIPAWWQTNWAKIIFMLLCTLVFGGLLKFFQIQIKKREQKRAQIEKHIAGLELQALRSQMNPHFVHNSLNAIQYYIQRSEVELSEKYLVKFSKLIRLFFEYSRKQNIALIDEVALLNNYLQIEQLRFEEKLQYKITIDEKIDQEEQLIPSMILQPIVENAVNHGLFHKQGNGFIFVNFTYINDICFKVTIQDDGIGINNAKEIYTKSSKNYQSRSSAVLKERLALLKQSNDWDITYQIEDLSNKNTTGTLVSVVFNQA